MSGLGFGIDIGGSGIKGAVVERGTGELAGDRFKLPTPQPSTPEAVAATVAEVTRHFQWEGDVGCTYPGVVQGGVARTAANVDKSWVGTSITHVVGDALGGRTIRPVNDADAAGYAEANFGAAKGQPGLVIVVTLGTGIGTALIYDGVLVPNSELGHVELEGVDYETRASAHARESVGMSWEKWAKRLQRYFSALESYLWPDLIVVGGGVSRKADRFLPLLELRTPIIAATLHNEAGIVGAALLAARAQAPSTPPAQAPSAPPAPAPSAAAQG